MLSKLRLDGESFSDAVRRLAERESRRVRRPVVGYP
ncbi:hypothetical protein JXL21_00320 [Candidatus Bathyarchaeota archaeon]|nr:hypothetical protein [Candidatus Bathyarchaeota archaeon]